MSVLVQQHELPLSTGEEGPPLHGDSATLAYPFFVLRNRPGQGRVRSFEWQGKSFEITASVEGFPTMRDRGILLFCMTRLIESTRRGGPMTAEVEFEPVELFRFLAKDEGYRPTSADYAWMYEALKRLTGSTIRTNIPTGGTVTRGEFSIIESYEVISIREESHVPRIVQVRISTWCQRAIQALEFQRMNPEYLEVRKPIERRLYEIALHHTQGRRTWGASLEYLMLHVGTRERKRDFIQRIDELAERNGIPDFRIQRFGSQVLFIPDPLAENSCGGG